MASIARSFFEVLLPPVANFAIAARGVALTFVRRCSSKPRYRVLATGYLTCNDLM
jgi:hypothetical protein